MNKEKRTELKEDEKSLIELLKIADKTIKNKENVISFLWERNISLSRQIDSLNSKNKEKDNLIIEEDKLRTLKDFERFCKSDIDEGNVSYSQLRQEAIKWKKYLELEDDPYDEDKEMTAQSFIKYFFNITEEELK